MYQILLRVRSVPAVMAAAAVLASSMVVAVPGLVSANGQCPITISEEGSTTVYPALVQAQPGFQSADGCNLNLVANGSGTGLGDLLNYSTTGVNIAASSRALKSGTEQNSLYAWKVGGDAMVLAVRNDAAMSCVTQITANQFQAMWLAYETPASPNAINNWNQINPACASMTVVPRSRILGSGSLSDMETLFGVTAGQEADTVAGVGLPRLTTSQDEADAACNNDGQIVYTSLANLLTYGPAGSGCLKALTLAGGSSSNYVYPSVTSVQNGTYPAPRTLYLAVNKFSVVGGSATTDNSANVKAYDLVNYFLSTAGQTAVAQVGFVNATIPSVQPIPDWDVNLDGAVGLGDLGNIIGRWGQTSTCKGWIRADVNNDGAIGLGDIGKVIAHWGGAGFVAPSN